MQPQLVCAFLKRFGTVVSRKTPGAVGQAARYLYRLEMNGYSYADCLKLLQETLKVKLSMLEAFPTNDDHRRLRDYALEGYHLVRRELQTLRGSPRKGVPCHRSGAARSGVVAHIDGSVRNDKASASFLLHAGSKELAVGTRRVNATTSSEAEMHALLLAMKTALAFGYRRLKVLTDAECLVDLMDRKSKLRHHPLGQEALALREDFLTFELEVVPRIYNHRADALALFATRGG